MIDQRLERKRYSRKGCGRISLFWSQHLTIMMKLQRSFLPGVDELRQICNRRTLRDDPVSH